MVKWTGSKPAKELLAVYLSPRVKRGIKVAASLEGKTISDLVEGLLVDYLRAKEGIGELIEKGG